MPTKNGRIATTTGTLALRLSSGAGLLASSTLNACLKEGPVTMDVSFTVSPSIKEDERETKVTNDRSIDIRELS